MRPSIVAAIGVACVVLLASSAASAEPPKGALPVAPTAFPIKPPFKGSTAADRNRAFVQHLYQDVLGRAADANSVAQLANGLTQGVMTRQQVAQTLLDSPEYATTVIGALYQRLLHRQADPQAMAAFVGLLQHGGTVEQVESTIIASDEYAQRAGGGFLDQVYQDLLGRHSDAPSRQQLVQTVMGTDEYANDVIGSIYQKYLRRPADAQGQAALRPVFRQAGSTPVIGAVVASDEYYQRP